MGAVQNVNIQGRKGERGGETGGVAESLIALDGGDGQDAEREKRCPLRAK